MTSFELKEATLEYLSKNKLTITFSIWGVMLLTLLTFWI